MEWSEPETRSDLHPDSNPHPRIKAVGRYEMAMESPRNFLFHHSDTSDLG